MSNRGGITVGLVVFLVVVTFPFWHTLMAAGGVSPPDLELPEGASRCIEDTPYMTANHMDLLNRWRDAVVREGQKVYTSSSGETYEMSLTGTCLSCHDSRETFCNRCHDYANVSPACWDCHVEPRGN